VIAALIEFIGSFLGFGASEAAGAHRGIALLLHWVLVVLVVLVIAWAITQLL
jgi:uncharacterized membrane protein YtjA (UPF0391 family)